MEVVLAEIGLERIWERPWIERLVDGKVRNGGLMSESDLDLLCFDLI